MWHQLDKDFYLRQVAVKEVYKAKIIKKTSDGKIPLEVALMQQVRITSSTIRIMLISGDTQRLMLLFLDYIQLYVD